MPIHLLTIFSENGERNTDGLNQSNGFPAAQKPARQWFNFLFHALTGKMNEIIEQVNNTSSSVADMVDHIYPVGVIVSFGIDFNPNTHFSGMTWVRHGEGRVAVGLSSQTNDPVWTKTTGSIFGAYDVTLNIDQIPKHKHGITGGGGDEAASTYPDSTSESVTATTYTDETGGDEAHNNVQPSIVVARWQRIA